MPEPAESPSTATTDVPGGSPVAEKQKKKKDKVRTAWISFFGRIVAQVLGAVATVVLGLIVLQRYQTAHNTVPAAVAPPAATAPVVGSPREAGIVALAVLPLANFSGDPRQDYFADGMTEALITDLAQIQGLRVISRTSSMQYKGKQKSLPQVAAELGVDLIVEGSVARAGDRVRITAQLIDAKSDAHLWARSYDETVKDVLALQGQVATAIAREVKGALPSTQQSRLAQRTAVDPAVYDLYLRGRHAWNLRTPAGFEQAIVFFNEALQKDPKFALAYAGLADSYSLSPTADIREARAKAKAAAERALELDEGLAEPHTSLATVLHRQGQIETAEREFRRALELNAGYATAHQWYSIMLAEQGRAEEAASHARQAVALDPLSGAMHQTLGLVYYYGRRFDLAVAEERRALELAPQMPLARGILARSLVAQGQSQAAIEACSQAPAPHGADILGTLSLAYFRAGDRARSESILKQLLERDPQPTGVLARVYAARGDRAAALQMLDRASGGGFWFQTLKSDPVFDGLRSDPRFAELLRRARVE